jgi:hypothetical protein
MISTLAILAVLGAQLARVLPLSLQIPHLPPTMSGCCARTARLVPDFLLLVETLADAAPVEVVL